VSSNNDLARPAPKGGFWRGAIAVIGTVLLVLLCALAVTVVAVPAATGGQALAVLSGSMEPTLKPGDLLIVSGVNDPDKLKVGDIVTFLPEPDDPSLITHRIIGYGDGKDGSYFVTRGDNNGADDPPVYPKQIRGKLLFKLPKLGYLTNWAGGEKRTAVVLFGVALIGYGAWQFFGRRQDSRGDRLDDQATPTGADPTNANDQGPGDAAASPGQARPQANAEQEAPVLVGQGPPAAPAEHAGPRHRAGGDY